MTLHGILDVIRQVAEKVDSSSAFKFVDGDGIFGTYGIHIVLMLHPERDCIVAAVGFSIFLCKCEDGHIIVLRANQSAAIHHSIVSRRNGAALDHIERVAESGLVVGAAKEVFQIPPNALLVEAAHLRVYVAEVKGLAVSFFRIEAVGTAQNMSSLITAT